MDSAFPKCVPYATEEAMGVDYQVASVKDDKFSGNALHAPVINHGPDSERYQDTLVHRKCAVK